MEPPCCLASLKTCPDRRDPPQTRRGPWSVPDNSRSGTNLGEGKERVRIRLTVSETVEKMLQKEIFVFWILVVMTHSKYNTGNIFFNGLFIQVYVNIQLTR